MAHPRLQRRKAGWFARIAVPLALRPTIGKIEIVRSLRTANHKEAVARLHVVSVEVDQMFREAAKKAARPMPPASPRIATEEQVVALIGQWFWTRQREAIARERACPSDDPALDLHYTEIELATMQDPEDPNPAAAAWSIVNEVTRQAGLAIPERGPLWRLAEQLARRAVIEELRQHRARLEGDHRGIVADPLFAGFDPMKPPPKTPPLLSEVMSDF
ncbi:MAG TPA: DUF6538 domain-containing protein, partial [Candidatus Acidoferrum sp.]|nr:DUF6538 domain-containing protein [Candidatus Acidoferrum sp.]